MLPPLIRSVVLTMVVVFLPLIHRTPPQDLGLIVNGRVARGVNLGNALEATYEGEWGMVIDERYFALITTAGFDMVRIPIRWSAHALVEPPYTIEPAFFQRIDTIIAQALDQGLITVINMHHYDALNTYPPDHEDRYLALWRQIAERYQRYDDALVFELLNEPYAGLDNHRWNALAKKAIAQVRQSNPGRDLIVGPAEWNSVDMLNVLELPEDDHLIVTFHYYEPFQFTHQGAEWIEGSRAWLGTSWHGTAQEQQAICADLDQAVDLAQARGWRLLLGEFGAYEKADMASRVRWTRFVRSAAESRGIAWAYWEFGAGFGVYDRQSGAWRTGLLDALVGSP